MIIYKLKSYFRIYKNIDYTSLVGFSHTVTIPNKFDHGAYVAWPTLTNKHIYLDLQPNIGMSSSAYMMANGQVQSRQPYNVFSHK